MVQHAPSMDEVDEDHLDMLDLTLELHETSSSPTLTTTSSTLTTTMPRTRKTKVVRWRMCMLLSLSDYLSFLNIVMTAVRLQPCLLLLLSYRWIHLVLETQPPNLGATHRRSTE